MFGGGHQSRGGGRDSGRGGRGGFRGRGNSVAGGRGRGEHAEDKPHFYLCRNHMRGSCRNANCRFAHVLSCVAEVPAHGMAVKSIVFMPDGSGLMTGSMDKSIKMWDLRPSPPSSQSIAVDGEVMHLTVEGPFLLWANSILPAYTPSDPVGVVELMDLASNVRVKCVRSDALPYTHPMPVVSFTSTVIGENLFVFTAGGEGLIRAWQFNKTANSFVHVTVLEGHTRGVTALLFIGGNLWSGSMDRSLRCWNLATGECVGTITSANDGHKEPVTSLESIKVKGEDFVVSGGADSMLKVWNLMGGIVFSESQGSVITSLKSSQDSFGNQLLLVGLSDGRISMLSESMQLLCRLDSHILCHNGAVWAIENCGQGFFASGGDDGKLILWKIDGDMQDKS